MGSSLIVPGAVFDGGTGGLPDGSLGQLQETELKHLICDQAPPSLRYRHAWAYGGEPGDHAALKTAFLGEDFSAGWPSGSYIYTPEPPTCIDQATGNGVIDPGFTIFRDPSSGVVSRYATAEWNTPAGTIAQSVLYYAFPGWAPQAQYASASSEYAGKIGLCISGWNSWVPYPGQTAIAIIRGQVKLLGAAPCYYFVANAQISLGPPVSIAYAFVQDGILAPGQFVEAPLPGAAPGGGVVENLNAVIVQPSSYGDWLAAPA